MQEDEDKIIVKPVSRLDMLFKDLREEAIQKGYTREELKKDLKEARQRVMEEYFSDKDNT